LQRVAQSQLRLIEANSKADIKLSAGVRRHEALNDTALVFGFSMPLTLSDPNAGLRRSHVAEQELLAIQQQASTIALNLLVQQQWLTLEQLRSSVQAIQSQLLPEALTLRQLSLNSYQQGQIDLLSVLSAEEELAQASKDLIESQARFHLTLLELERLTGQPMIMTSTKPVVMLENTNV